MPDSGFDLSRFVHVRLRLHGILLSAFEVSSFQQFVDRPLLFLKKYIFRLKNDGSVSQEAMVEACDLSQPLFHFPERLFCLGKPIADL